MFVAKFRKTVCVVAAMCVCTAFCACSNDGGRSEKTVVTTVTDKNTASGYVASKTGVVSEDVFSDVTTKVTTTSPKTTSFDKSTTTVKTAVSSENTKKTVSTSEKTTVKSTVKTTQSTTYSSHSATKPSATTNKKPETPTEKGEPQNNKDLLLENVPDADRTIYQKITRAIKNFESEITFIKGSATQEQVENALLMISLANLEDNYVSSEYVITVDDKGYVSKLRLTFTKSKDRHLEEKEKLSEIVNEIVQGCKETDEYGIVTYLHDEIISRCSYDTKTDNMLNAYGCLVEGKAVCEGYAKAFIMLCDEFDIACLPVGGVTKDENGNDVLHMWNIVRIDGEWYHFDLTWDDPTTTVGGDFISYDYFGLSDEEITKDHEITPLVYVTYPDASNNQGDYFTKNNLIAENISDAKELVKGQILDAVKNGERFVRIKISDEQVFESFRFTMFEDEENGPKGIFVLLAEAADKTASELFNPRRYSKMISEDKKIITIVLSYE